MARFDVHVGPDEELLLDCQADVLSHFETRLVVPLLPAKGTLQASRLHPIFAVEDQRVVMVTQLASAVPRRILRRKITSLADEQPAIMNALDMLLTGG
ncbi:MAG: CcdB family protein [Pseudomonadota bacterium]|nr:CcdB family protein [Pseudomonadota bacterium]